MSTIPPPKTELLIPFVHGNVLPYGDLLEFVRNYTTDHDLENGTNSKPILVTTKKLFSEFIDRERAIHPNTLGYPIDYWTKEGSEAYYHGLTFRFEKEVKQTPDEPSFKQDFQAIQIEGLHSKVEEVDRRLDALESAGHFSYHEEQAQAHLKDVEQILACARDGDHHPSYVMSSMPPNEDDTELPFIPCPEEEKREEYRRGNYDGYVEALADFTREFIDALDKKGFSDETPTTVRKVKLALVEQQSLLLGQRKLANNLSE